MAWPENIGPKRKAPTACPPFIECTDRIVKKQIVKCSKCRVFSPVRTVPCSSGAHRQYGECRKNAPVMTDNPRGPKFPTMCAEDWCGEGEG